jgi:hypothetical protein
MADGKRTQKPGKVSLHPLKFEDALKGLLKTKPPEKKADNQRPGTDEQRASTVQADQ